jgi:hypothetical protein
VSNHKWDKGSPFVLFLSIAVLVPICQLESMKHISYVSGVAIASILTALSFVITANLHVLHSVSLSGLKMWDPSMLPYFMGTAAFMFEGNAVMLEVHAESEDPKTNFQPVLRKAMTFTVGLICTIGILSYGAYQDGTHEIVLLNLSPGVSSWSV